MTWSAPATSPSPVSTGRLLRDVLLDLVLVLAWMMPAAIMPMLAPAASTVLLAACLALFLWWSTRPPSDTAGRAIGYGAPQRALVPALVLSAVLLGTTALLLQAWLYRVLPPIPSSATKSALEAYQLRRGGTVVVGLFLIIYAPVVEEFVFRRRILGRLVSRVGEPLSIVSSAALFTALHLSLSTGPYHFALGLLFGVVAVRTGTVWSAVLLHMANNAAPVVLEQFAGTTRVDRWLDATGLPVWSQVLLTLAAIAATSVAMRPLLRARQTTA